MATPLQITVRRGVPVPMPDGAVLLADHYAPRGAGRLPAILIRTPYGRAGETPFATGLTLAELPARRLAAHGYHVVVQGVRGCFGSGGAFEPHVNEGPDGAATAAWVARQPWFGGRLGAWGPSYLGYCQWAAAAHAPGALHAVLPIVACAEPHAVAYPDGAFGLETRLRWAQSVHTMAARYRAGWRRGLPPLALWRDAAALRRAFGRLPLAEADLAAVGEPLPTYRAALAHPRRDAPFWRARDHTGALAGIAAPAHLIAGWHDYFLRPMLRDYAALAAAGRAPHLTVGPWWHAHPGPLLAGLREGARWFDAHLRGGPPPRGRPVRLFVMGAGAWRELDAFPPPAAPRRLFLRAGGALAPHPPDDDPPPTRYRYDPADPTPAAGGQLLDPRAAGPRDTRPVERRADVICFTTEPLAQDVEVIGEVPLELFVRSSLAHTDWLGRLCDVAPDGRSLHVCEGLARVAPGVGERREDGCLRLAVVLGPTAYRFRRGHRIRLQVASGAHPRWARNLGTGEPEASGTAMAAAEQEVFHDRERRSAVVLPVG